MHKVSKDGVSAQINDRDNIYKSIVLDLTALIDRVHTSVALIESAISHESPFGNQEIAANVIVLDDITPAYMRANIALNACTVDLSVALHFLKDIETSEKRGEEPFIQRPRVRLPFAPKTKSAKSA